MQISSKVTGLVGAAAGLVAAVAAYQGVLALSQPMSTQSGKSSFSVPKDAPSSAAGPRFAACDPPARLVAGACVTHVERTIVVYDRSAQASLARRSAEDDPEEYDDGEDDRGDGSKYDDNEDDPDHGDDDSHDDEED